MRRRVTPATVDYLADVEREVRHVLKTCRRRRNGKKTKSLTPNGVRRLVALLLD